MKMVQLRILNVHDYHSHLNENDNLQFKWSFLSLAPKISFARKILNAYFIKTLNPILSNQLNSNILALFRNGVT